MAGFAKDVTTPIEIPAAQPVNLQPGATPAHNAAQLLTFGLQVRQKNQAIKAEEARQATVTKGLAIAQQLESARGQMSNEKVFVLGQKLVRESGGSLIDQAQIGSIVANQFGAATLNQGIMTESEKFSNDLEQEFNGLGDFGDIALMEKFPNTTSSELDNDSMEVTIERARQLKADSIKADSDKQATETAIENGNLNTVSAWFKADKDQFNSVGGVMTSLYSQQLNLASQQGIELVGEPLQQMKESVVSVMQSQKRNLQTKFSGDNLIKIPDAKDRAFVKSLVDDREKFYDDQIKFLNDLEEDEFKNYFDTAALLKDKDNLDLMRNAPELLKMKNLVGTQAFGTLVIERMAKDPAFRNQLKSVMNVGFETQGFDQNDQFAAGVAIMAGIGKGKSIQDYDDQDKSQASNVYWSTVQGFMNTPNTIENSTQEGITSMSIAAVQVLEFAEERGTIEDKQRALQTINSPQFKKLYDKAPPEIREAMGRKVIQYNRDTLENNVNRILKDTGGSGLGSTMSYNATSGKFEIEFEHIGTTFAGDPQLHFVQKQQKAKVEALNKQLDVARIYGQDDPFISSLSEREARDFFVRSSGLPPSAIKGKLSEFTPQQQEASSKGITVVELKEATDIVKTTTEAAGAFADIDRRVQQSNLPKGIIDKALRNVQNILDGNDPDDTSDMTDEEFEEFQKLQREARAK